MKISVADLSAPIGASVFKFSVHKAHLASFSIFLLSLLYNTYGRFLSEFSQQVLDLGL